MTRIELGIEQMEAIGRADAGYVRRRGDEWDAEVFGPVLVYDSLSTLPDGAVQALFDDLLGLGWVAVDGESVTATDAGLAARGTGVADSSE